MPFRRIILISFGLVFSLSEAADAQVHHIEKRWADFPNVSFTFDCTDRPIGFYADVEHDCMIFHMCDEDGRRIPYMCANETSFNQKFRVCDWNYNVDCASSPDWYFLNDLTYRTDPPKSSTESYNVRRRKSKWSAKEPKAEENFGNKIDTSSNEKESASDIFDESLDISDLAF